MPPLQPASSPRARPPQVSRVEAGRGATPLASTHNFEGGAICVAFVVGPPGRQPPRVPGLSSTGAQASFIASLRWLRWLVRCLWQAVGVQCATGARLCRAMLRTLGQSLFTQRLVRASWHRAQRTSECSIVGSFGDGRGSFHQPVCRRLTSAGVGGSHSLPPSTALILACGGTWRPSERMPETSQAYMYIAGLAQASLLQLGAGSMNVEASIGIAIMQRSTPPLWLG